MNIINEIIYLDNAFIVDAYQQIKDKDVAVKYTKTTDVSVGINLVAKAGASLKESFEYPISTHSMYKEIESNINEVENIDLTMENHRNLPDLFWMEGIFGIGSITKNSGKENEIKSYFFSAASTENKSSLCLSTNDVYFSSGYDQLIGQAEGFSEQFVIEAKMLLKSLGTTRNHSLASPIVILKKRNWEFQK